MKKQSGLKSNKGAAVSPPKMGLHSTIAASPLKHPYVPDYVMSRTLTDPQRWVLSDIAFHELYPCKKWKVGWAYLSASCFVANGKNRFKKFPTNEGTIRGILTKLRTLQVVDRCAVSERMRFGSRSHYCFGYKISSKNAINKILIEYMESMKSVTSQSLVPTSQSLVSHQSVTSQSPNEVEVEGEVEETTILSPTEVEVSVPPAITPRTKKVVGASPMSTPHGSTWLQKLIYEWEALQTEFHGMVTVKDRAVVMNAVKMIVGRLGLANGFTNSQEEHDKVVQVMRTYFQTNSGEYKAVFFYKQIKDGLLDIAQMATISMVAPTGLAYELVDPAWELTQERKEILDTIQMNYKDKASVSVRMTALGIPQAKL